MLHLLDGYFVGKQRHRVDGSAVFPDFEMDMRPRRPAALAYQGDGLSAADALSLLDQIFMIVRIMSGVTVRMGKDDALTIPPHPTAEGHRSRQGRTNHCPYGAGDVDAMVKSGVSLEWIRAFAKGGRELADDRQDHRLAAGFGWRGSGWRASLSGRHGFRAMAHTWALGYRKAPRLSPAL